MCQTHKNFLMETSEDYRSVIFTGRPDEQLISVSKYWKRKSSNS